VGYENASDVEGASSSCQRDSGEVGLKNWIIFHIAFGIFQLL